MGTGASRGVLKATHAIAAGDDAHTTNPWHVSLAAAIGSFIEYYDFGVYGVMALTLGPLFFVGQTPATALLSALLVYASAFVIRPLGAIVFGWMGDKHGRRNTLIVTVVGMGTASALIGVLPTYATAGVAAPALLVLLRLVQGFFAGGEVSGAATYVAECAPEGRRGFFGSINVAGVIAGGAGAAFTAAIVRTIASPEGLASWGWRLPFFVSLPLLVIGLYARLRLADSPRFEEVVQHREVARAPLLQVIEHHAGALAQTIGLAFGMTVTGLFSSVYLLIYIIQVAKLPQAWASWTFACVECVAVMLTPLVGLLSDRVGRKPPVVVGLIGYMILVPLAMVVMRTQSLPAASLMLLLLALPHAGVQGAVYPIYPELFPTRVRYTGMAFGFNIAIIAGGGLAPWVSTKLVELFENPIAGSLYVVIGSLVALATLATVRDSSRVPLAD